MIQTCLLDMGNVVVNFSHQRMCEQVAGVCGKTADKVREILFGRGLEIDFECGRLTETEFHQRFEAEAGVKVDADAFRRAASDIFTANDGMPAVLDALRSAGLRLVLLSNTCVSHIDWVRGKFDVLNRFDDFVLSCEVGAIKPDAAMYEAALEKIECDPANCFYTDDIPENITAGRAFGFAAEVFTDPANLVQQLRSHGVRLDI